MASRSTAICISIWIIIVASAYLALSVLGYKTYKCDLKTHEGSTVSKAFDLTYFYNEKCPTEYDITGIDLQYIKLNIDIGSPSSARTVDWSIAYMVLSSLWIVTSFLLLGGAICRVTGCMLSFTVIPWVLVAAANIVADVVATIQYSLDIPNTSIFRKFLEFADVNITVTVNDNLPVGVTEDQVLEKAGEEIENFRNSEVPLTWVPSVVMTVIFARFLLLWINNIVCLILVIIDAIRFKKSKPSESPAALPSLEHNKRPISMINNEYNNNSHLYQPPMTVQGLNSRPDNINPIPSSKFDPNYTSQPPETSWLSRKNNSNGNDVVDKPSNLKREFELRSQNKSPVNNEELRSQLPWSYTQDRSDQLKRAPPRPAHLDEPPPVPVPDYTLHFPKKKREEMDRANIRSITPPEASSHNKNNEYRNSNNIYYKK